MKQFNNHPLYRVHNMDTAISSLWDFYKERFIKLFIISFVMSLIVQYASTFINLNELQSITDPQEMLAKISDYLLPMFLVVLINLFFITILQYYVIFSPVDDTVTVLNSITGSLKYFIPYLIIMILVAFAGSFLILLGLVLLVVGVFFALVYLLTIYFFILPLLMAEGPNIYNTITRTVSLAHRRFWQNLGWTAVFLIILIVVSVILSGIVLLPFTGSFLKAFTNPENADSVMALAKNPLFIVLSAIVNALTYPLVPVFSAIMYFNGRANEDASSNAAHEEGTERKVRVEDLYAPPVRDESDDKTSIDM
ncbi:MAG: hypothetical protein HPY62_12400 [Bacteroidales bacterium]|nr:hypothetical protein [Bacteroidales bacterium]